MIDITWRALPTGIITLCLLLSPNHGPTAVAMASGDRAIPQSDVSSHSAGGACSSVAFENGGATIFGANLDHVSVHRGLVFINPRGLAKTSLSPGTTGTYARWTSRYASVTFNLVGYEYAWAGMNERGLVLSTMSLPTSVTPRPDPRPPLDSGEWMQYMLDTCATVEEIVATDRTVRIVTVDHYLVADGSGTAATIEFLDGRLVVHSGESLPARALTNSVYAQALAVWDSYRATGNTDYSRLNGSLQRFCLAADRAAAHEPSASADAVAYAFQTLATIAGEHFSMHASQWSLVFDTANLEVSYTTLTNRGIRTIDLRDFDPWCDHPIQMLDIDVGPSGDVAPYFSDYSHDVNFSHMRNFLQEWGIPFTEQALRNMVRYLESFPCQRYRSPRRHLNGQP